MELAYIYIYIIKYTEVLLSNAAFCRFYSVLLPVAAKSNSTRLRFWQPEHEGNFFVLYTGADSVRTVEFFS